MRMWTIWPAVVLALLASLATAQVTTAPPEPQTSQTPLQVRSNLVVVPALIRDAAGHPVFSLRPEDFVLTDDGVPQPVTLEEDSGGQPLALVVLIEAGAATRAAGWKPKRRGDDPDRLQSLPAWVEALAGGVEHRVAVVGFDSEPELLQPFTADLDAVGGIIRQLTASDNGDHGAATIDALAFSIDLLRGQPTGYRRAILLVSETNDHDSRLPLADAIRRLNETNTAIFSIGYSTGGTDASHYGSRELPTKQVARKPGDPSWTNIITLENPTPNPPGGCFRKDPDPSYEQANNAAVRSYDCFAALLPPLALAKMAAIATRDGLRENVPKTVAELTGGEYLPFNSPKSVEDDLNAIANHLPNRYILTFQPRQPHAGLHALELRVPRYAGVQVTARRSYWADAH